MKSQVHYVFAAVLVLFHFPLSGGAATIWNGPLITYTQPASDPTQAANQDLLTTNVSLTRAVSAGMFNGLTETAYTHDFSPADTEWAVGRLDQYSSLTYTSWEQAGGGTPVITLPGQQLVLHLIKDDIYLSLKFTSLGGHFSGGFSYERSTPAVTDAPPTVTLDSPTNGATFSAPANITLNATAQDADGNVTNVSFFDEAALLGGTNQLPYSIVTSLAVGGHALTAVATDNAGLSTTSSVVNVTVNSINPILSVTASSNALDISWPVAGGRLQAQTNSLGTNWSTVPGSTTTNHVVVPIDPSNGSVFYRLIVP